MEVQVISKTAQKFDGVSYYLCGTYYQRKGVRLHRKVWEYHNGKIPEGYDVHHVDGDRSNNQISNLKLLRRDEHHRTHITIPERIKQSRESIKNAREYAKDWHRSAEGRMWHSIHAKNAIRTPQKFTCAWCGCEFESLKHSKEGVDRFCCNNHKAAALRWRRKHEGQNNYPSRQS